MNSTLLNRGKKISILVGILCGILLAFVWGSSQFLETRFSQRFFLNLLHGAIPGHLSFEKMELAVFAGQVDVEGLVLQGPDGQDLVRVEKLSLNLSWLKLLSGEICLSSVLLNSPEFDIGLLENGSLNLLSAFVPSPPSPPENKKDAHEIPLNILVNEFVLNKGSIVFKMPGNDLTLLISGLDIQIFDVDLWHESAGFRANFETGKVLSRGRSVLLNSSRVGADLKDGGLSNVFVRAGASIGDMKIQGSIKNLFTDPFLDMTLESRMVLEQAALIPGMESLDLLGTLAVNLSLKGGFDNPGVTGSILSEKAGFNGYPIENLMLEYRMKDRLVTLLPSRVSSGLGKLSLEGKIDLGEAFPKGFREPFDLNLISYGMDAVLDGVFLSALPEIWPGTKGGLASRINFQGRGIDPEKIVGDITAELTGTGLGFPGMAAPMDAILHADIGYDAMTAEFKSVRLAALGMVLTGRGQVNIPDKKVSGRLNLEADDIGSMDELTRVRGKGHITATAEIDGPFANPSVSLSALGSNLGIDNIILGNLELNASLDRDGRVKVDKLSLENQASSLHAGGWMDLIGRASGGGPKNAVHLDLTLAMDLTDFMPLPSLGGAFKGKAMVRGSLKEPIVKAEIKGHDLFFNQIRVKEISAGMGLEEGVLNLNGDSIGVGEQRIDSLSSKIVFRGRAMEIVQMDIQVSPGSMITAKGEVIPQDQTFDIRVDSQNFDLTCLDLFEKKGVDGGLLSLNLAVRGSFKDPMVKGKLGIRELVIFQEKQGPMDFSIELKSRRLGIKGDLGLTMEGEYQLDTRAFTAALNMEDFNLSPYLKLLGQPQLTGVTTGRVRAEGQADKLEQIRASAYFSKIVISFADKPFIRLKGADLTFEKGQLDFASTRIELLEKGSLTVKGWGKLGGPLDFEVKGEIPLEIINPLVEEVESATGLIRLEASLKGSPAAPLVKGDLLFNGLGMAVDGLEQDFKNIEGHIRLTRDKIEFLGVKGYLDEGRFDLGGSVGLKEWAAKTFDLKFNAHQLNLDIPDLMEVSLNCGLNFIGTDQASALSGEIILLEGRYYKDVELDLIETTQRTRKIKPLEGKEWPGFLKTIDLNVHISRREPLLVDNNLADLEVSPDLTILGTAASPLLTGRAQVDSGSIHFQRAEFEVKKGVIDFVNPYKIEPTIDIEGETEIRGWTITLAVSGTPENLEFKFSSNPPEQHVDILSLIAFGKTTRELRATDGGGRFAPEDILAGMMAESLQKSLKDATGLDYLEINTEDKESGSAGVNVSLGADLSRQISVKYGVNTRNGESVQRVTTYYKLLEHLLMSGYQDTDGKFGGELKYRLEFR